MALDRLEGKGHQEGEPEGLRQWGRTDRMEDEPPGAQKMLELPFDLNSSFSFSLCPVSHRAHSANSSIKNKMRGIPELSV